MPTLNDKTKDALKGLLNNLNLGLAKADFGAVVVSLIEGTPVTLDDKQKSNLAQLVNNLNLGTAHANLGDLLIALLDNATAHTAASALTGNEREKIRQLCNNLNLGLHAADFGGYIDGAISTAAAGSAAVVTPPKPALNKFTLTGTGVSADSAANTYKVTVKSDGSDAVEVTVGKDPAGAEWGTLTPPAIDTAGEAFVDKDALNWDATAHTFTVTGTDEGNATITVGNSSKTVTLKVTVVAP